jgi:hypothetical protein
MQAGARSVFVAPKAAEHDEDWADMAEEAMDAGRKRDREAARMNRISTYLGERFYRTCKTWPFLYWKVAGVQLSVDMYFPTKNLAVDRFPRPTSLDRQAAAFKAMVLRAKGVNYVALFPENRLADLERFK